jgi:signal transduction histidine kinase/ActR/RegA family two-component response regulator
MSEITGYSLEELTGMDGLLLIAPQSRKDVMANIVAGYEKPYEAMGIRKNGEEFYLRLEARNVPYKGRMVRTVEFRDITQHKQAEAEREKLQAQLTQVQKMESVGRLAGGIAHDFNNMLAAILGNVSYALRDLPPDSPLRENLEEIEKCAHRSADLTRQLLAFARKQTVAPKVLDLNATVEGMLKMLRRLIGEDVDLTWAPTSDLWPVKIDPGQVDQILANLCVNARDAIVGVGKITLETCNTTFDDIFVSQHPGFVPGEYVQLCVSDNGCGIDKETLAHLFEPFFTTKGVGQGTGLGLATVYGIVRQNHGFINVYSEPAHGSRFTIYLPRHADKAARLESINPVQPAASGHGTILLVEDEPSLLRIGKRALESLGYTVLTASTPGEAIRRAGEHSGPIHLLLTDVVMPEMDGRELALRLHSLYPALKRLFMSGYTANVIAHHGVLDEGIHFIQKPFTITALADKVREALAEGSKA